MLDVAISEEAVDIVLRRNFFGEESIHYTLLDGLDVKTILAQLKALGLVYSEWSKEQSALFWGLTPKGTVTRNKMILVRNTQKEEA